MLHGPSPREGRQVSKAAITRFVRHMSGQRSGLGRAAGIYGTVITAAIIDTAGGHGSTTQLVIAVAVTLFVYWVAEQYAELLGQHTEHGHLPSWAQIRAAFLASSPMVAACFVPLVGLVIARLVGASDAQAAIVGLVLAVLQLVHHGWAAGRAVELHGKSLLVVTLVAAALGVLMILLKELVLLHLH
jgi:hypothetical protein